MDSTYLMISPSPSHSGFDRFKVGEDTNLHGGDYFHNLHHRYFEVNYGMLLLPLDKWFGTFHDGSVEAHDQMKSRRRASAETDDTETVIEHARESRGTARSEGRGWRR